MTHSTFSLHPKNKLMLKELSARYEISMTNILERLIKNEHEKAEGLKKTYKDLPIALIYKQLKKELFKVEA